MGITEEILKKKREQNENKAKDATEDNSSITQMLLQRRKAGLRAMPSPAETVGRTTAMEGPMAAASAQNIRNLMLQNRRNNAPSPMQAVQQLGLNVSPVTTMELPTATEPDYVAQALEDNGRMEEIRQEIQAAEKTQWDNPLPKGVASGLKFAQTMRDNPEEGLKQVRANLEAQDKVKALTRERDRIKYIRSNAGKTYEDNFFGQFGASYALGRMRQDESLAWNKYIDEPTEENRAYAEAISQLIAQFETENADTLDDDATMPWISQSLANYLPQFWDQVQYGAVGAIGGAAAGSAVPVLGTSAGIKAGITAASGLYSYQTMRGAAFKTLLDLGASEEVARAAAGDEAVVSSLIEMADTGIDLLTLGGGKLISAITKGGVKNLAKEGAEKAAESAGKKLLKALGKYGLNVAGEFTEEATQQAVSIANANRVEAGVDNGILGLMADAGYGVLWEAAENADDPNRAEILKAGFQGAIVAGLMGPMQAGFNQLAFTGLRTMDNKVSADYGQQLRQQGFDGVAIEAGMKFPEGSSVYNMAQALQQKQQAGQEITDVELGDLYRSIKLGAQQELQNTVQTARSEAARQQSMESGIILPTADDLEVIGTTEGGVRETGMLAGAREADIESAERISQAMGRNVEFFREEAGQAGTVNGFYDSNTGTIYINSQSRNPVAQIIAHELTHSVEMAESYQELKTLALEQLERDGVNLEERRQQVRDLYQRNGKVLAGNEEIDSELVAQFVETKLLTDEATIMELTRINRPLMERVLSWINRTLQQLGLKKTTERDTLERAREIYAKALLETEEQTGNPDIRYSVSEKQKKEPIQVGIMLPTADEKTGPVMLQENESASTQQERDAYFDGLMEEADQNDEPKKTVTKKDVQEFWDMVEGTEVYKKLTINSENKVRTDANKNKKTAGQSIKDAYRAFIRSMVDSGEAVQRAGKIANDERLYEYYNAARAASSAAENMIQNERTDILGKKTGDSLIETLKTVRSRGQDYYRYFQLYLYHTHNVDRMSRESMANVQQAQEAFADVRKSMPELGQFADYQIEQMARDPGSRYYEDARQYISARNAMRRAEGIRNKPVFGPEVTADVSRQEAAKLLREHPEFEEEAQKVYDYLDNLMKYRIDSGLVTEQEAQMLKQIYPHYVPVYREFERSSTDTREKNRVQIGKTIKRAIGGEEIIMPLHKSMALQTRSVVREGTKNRFGIRLLEDKLPTFERGKELVRNVQETEPEVNENTFDQLEDAEPKRKNIFTVREDGKRYDLEVDPSLFAAVEALGNNGEAGNNILTATVRKFNNLFKAMVTGYNPAFMARNFIRDLQDAALYSKDAKAWAANYPAAIKEIAANGEYWRQYKALGGVHSSVFDYETGMTRESKNPASKILNRVEALNMAVEQAPRLAEFIATVKKAENAEAGVTMDTLMEALYNANDITTNFGRSGTIGKWLNANLVPFLNTSIQGFDKMLRQLGETKGFKSWANLAAKAALLGIAPAVINQFVYGDEDDWDKIKQRDRDVYYLFKIGDGKWLKIPKGRALSLAGMAANRTIEAARGEQIDVLDTLNTAISQTAPSNPLENNILQAWMDADLLDKDSPGKTWYGSDIESQRLQNYAPGERYDQSTDKLSKFLGQATGLSPAKINYLLDQYTGVVGDILLPMITPSDTSIPGLAPVASAFTLDTAYSNRTSGDFYETLDQLTYAKNKEDANGYETVVYRFFNKQADAVGEINAAIREIEADEALSDAEKRELVRAQYQIRNSVEEQALDQVAAYQAAAEKHYEASDKEDEEDKIEEAYREANREIMGAEYALKTYSKEVYERAAALQEDGVSYDTFFDLYFENRDTELTGYEKTNRTRDLLRELDVDEEQKKALYKDFISDSETNQERIKSLEDAGATFDDFLTIQNKYNEINETVDKAKQKSVAFAYWLDTEGFTEEQSVAAQGAFKFYSQIPGQDTTYEKFKNSGLSAEEAYRLAAGLDTLEPDKGNETVTKEQKWREVLDSDLSSEKKLAALKSVSTETQAEKFEIADAYGVDLEEYVSIMERLPEFDADGNGRYTQSEVTNAINSIMSGGTGGLVLPNLSDGLVLPVAGGGENRDKAVLWQLITGSKSAKNNPYSVEIGEEVLRSLGQNSGGLVLPDLGGSSGGLVLPDLGGSSGGLVLPDLG